MDVTRRARGGAGDLLGAEAGREGERGGLKRTLIPTSAATA